MKNKLLKTLTCFASISAIGSTIAITSTSCGCSNSTSNVLPDEVYNIDDRNYLLGFTDEFLANPDAYSKYNTMEIPARVEIIFPDAFASSEREVVPSYITKLTFAKNSNCSSIGSSAFFHCPYLTSIDFSNATKLEILCNTCFAECSLLTSVTFPSSLTTIDPFVFSKCPAFNDIKWNSWAGDISLSSTSFSGVCPTGGTVTVKNPVDGHNSDKLLKFLLDNGGLPSTWAKSIPLPESVYDIDQNNVLQGFTNEFLANPSAYSECNTMEIPTTVTSVNDYAFVNTYVTATTIPSYITKLTFAKNSNCSSIGNWSFGKCSSLTFVDLLNCSNFTTIDDNAFRLSSSLVSVKFPSSLETIGNSAFWNCSSLNYIAWDLPDEYESKIGVDNAAFSQISSTGTVKSLNTSIASSQDLLNWIKTKGSFPSGDGWEPAK